MENGKISSSAMDDESFVVILVGIRTRGLRIHTTPPPPPPPKPHTRTYQVRIIHSPAMAFVLLVIPQGVREMQLQQVRLAIKGKVLAILLFVRVGGWGERGREARGYGRILLRKDKETRHNARTTETSASPTRT